MAADPAGLPGGIKLIHAYGHGGAGVTSSWGVADEIMTLTRSAPAPRPMRATAR